MRRTSHGHLLAGHSDVRNGVRYAAHPRAVHVGVSILDPAGHPLGDHGRADRPARRSGTHHPALPGEGSAPARPDLSPDAEQEYFVDGINEEIIKPSVAQEIGDGSRKILTLCEQAEELV